MAVSAYGVNANEAKKLWSEKLFHEVTAKTFWGKFMGKGSDSLIQQLTDTQKDKGDRIRITLRMLASGSGIQGDSTLEGNEEALTTYTDNLLIDQLRHAARTGGRVSEQRVPFEMREECRLMLEDWWAERLDISMANTLTGNTGQADSRYSGNNATSAPTTANSITRIICANGEASESSLSNSGTTWTLKLTDLDRAVAYAKTQQPRIRPIRVNGKEMYVAFLHPYQIYQLRKDASTAGNFYDVQKAILQGGKIEDNPIINGADFVYNNVAVHEWAYLPNTLSAQGGSVAATIANYRRGVFCGAQSAVFAVGQANRTSKMEWVEEVFDYENQFGVAAGMIFGLKKCVFNSNDFATIVLSSYAPTP